MLLIGPSYPKASRRSSTPLPVLYGGMSGKKWTDLEEKIFLENYEKLSNRDLQKLLPDRSIEAIKTRAAKILKLKKKIIAVRIGNVEPLLHDTPEAYYWIGFIFADGSILGGNRLSVTISSSDVDHLRKLSNLLGCNITAYKRKLDQRVFCSVRVKDSKLVPELCRKFDLKKSKTQNPPIINIEDNDFFIAFLAGFIDGDGNITNVAGNRGVNIRIKLHASWIDNLLYIEKRVYEAVNHTSFRGNVLSKINSSGYAQLCISDGSLLRKLKTKALKMKLPLIERKWNKIDCSKISKYESSNALRHNVINLLDCGESLSSISKRLNKNYQTIYSIVKRMSLKQILYQKQ